jgi:Domain of unknown function DUF11
VAPRSRLPAENGMKGFLLVVAAVGLFAAERRNLEAGPPQADLLLTVTTPSATVAPGARFSYTATVTNLGPSASPSVTVFHLLGLSQFRAADPPVCTNGSPIECAIGPLAVGAQATVTVEVDLFPSVPEFVSDNLFASGPLPDPDSTNNQPFVSTPVVVPAPVLELAHGSELFGSSEAAEGVAGDRMRILQQPYASYEVLVDATSGDIVGPSGVLLERVGVAHDPPLQSADAIGVGPSRSLRFANTSSAAVTDELVRVRTGVWPVPGDGNDVWALRARETTYAVPRFNNSATQVTVLLVQNPTASSVQATAYFWSQGGALVGTHGPVAIAAHGLLVLDTRDVPGASAAAGSITIVHDAPYGALAGKAVAVEPGTGFSFDSPLEPRRR